MPNRPRSHTLEDLSRNRLHAVFEKLGWTVEDIAKDYGEDLLVRIFERGRATPLKFFVQAKATDNIFRFLAGKTGMLRVPVKREHALHWKKFNDPVILTLWDSHSDVIYWICIQTAFDKLPRQLFSASSKRKAFPVSIPLDNVLDKNGLRRIHKISRAYHQRASRERKGSEILRATVEDKLGVKIEYSSGSGTILIQKHGEALEVHLFGKTLAALKEIARKRKISLRAAFKLALEQCHAEFLEFERSGLYPVRNEKTGKRELFKLTRRQLRDQIQREFEEMDENL